MHHHPVHEIITGSTQPRERRRNRQGTAVHVQSRRAALRNHQRQDKSRVNHDEASTVRHSGGGQPLAHGWSYHDSTAAGNAKGAQRARVQDYATARIPIGRATTDPRHVRLGGGDQLRSSGQLDRYQRSAGWFAAFDVGHSGLLVSAWTVLHEREISGGQAGTAATKQAQHLPAKALYGQVRCHVWQQRRQGTGYGVCTRAVASGL